jgi:transposase InsO family protein
MNTSYKTLERNTIKYMIKHVEEYERIRNKRHEKYKKVREFFKEKKICFQNFYKFYNRYIRANRDEKELLPIKRGPKARYQEMSVVKDEVDRLVLEYRRKGYNKYIISDALKKEHGIEGPCSASTIYRIFKRYDCHRLERQEKEEKQKIVRDYMGSLGHVDCHFLPKGVVKSEPGRRYYVEGCIDDYSRLCWIEIIESTKAIDATFAMMDILLVMNQRYGITFDEILTDNGSEFCGSNKDLREHPFERLLLHFAIKHRKTKPYRPQTNGKIERFWRTFHEDVIEGAEYNNLDELKDAVLGYNFYYNEHRPHQSLGGKKPLDTLKLESK